MSKVFKVWLDSGANIHSRYENIVSLDELGFTDEEFAALSGDEKDNIMRDIAWERMDWGYQEVDSDE